MLYVRGEDDPSARALLAAIEMFEKAHENDSAYRDAIFKLDQVEQELDTVIASPGHRAALRAMGPNAAGQIPSHREERPSSAEA